MRRRHITAMPSPAVALHWFRKGLRLHDNPALLEAAQARALLPGASRNRPLACDASSNPPHPATNSLRGSVLH